jgi:DNA-binding NtrC family response regulator/tetratricopeptide (TPR) repeat protein
MLREVRRHPLQEDPVQLALEEAQALLALSRYAEGLVVATRALRRRPRDPDRAARLRIVRAQALWEIGRVALARNELLRVPSDTVAPLTRARLEETWARIAWKDQENARAQEHLARARGLYEEQGCRQGVVRTLEMEGAVLRETGRLDEALARQKQRLDIAETTSRRDEVARARADRGALLIMLGRWKEACVELDQAATIFHDIGDPCEVTVAGVTRAMADMATGDVAAARRALEKACEFDGREGASPRALADDNLLLADMLLAAGRADAAEAASGRALRAFLAVRDRGGECWARIRRSQALLGLGRCAAAMREARRAVALAPDSKVHLFAWARLALGRILLRVAPTDARVCFEAVTARAVSRPDLVAAAEVGLALSRRPSPEDAPLREAIARLEAWGDRRLLSLCLGDVRDLLGTGAGAGMGTGSVHECQGASAAQPAAALVTAASALAQGEGWAVAAEAVRQVLPWHRMVWFADEPWELSEDGAGPRRLSQGDVAREIKAQVAGPAFVSLAQAGAYSAHPQRALHNLEIAVVVPLGDRQALYADFPAGRPVSGDEALGILAQLGRLLVAHRATVGAAPGQITRDGPCAGIVGECVAMREVYRSLRQAAAWDMPVHVFGETGTGKDLAARAVHLESRRSCRPLKIVNGSALSDELVESQVFGHARGAFTGAVAASEGLAAAADGGTLFIDEIADLSLRVQAKLLRFVQDGEYCRLGETETRTADVRIVTASNADLQRRVAEGRFRQDLYYRLCDWVLTLPPLRERGDDILRLARHFLRDFTEHHGRPTPPLPRDIGQALCRYQWPGNVRQLRAEMCRLIVSAEGGPLLCEHLSPDVLGDQTETSLHGLREARLVFEREFIGRALACHGGNRARTAAALGLTRQGLLGKIRQTGIA